MTAPVRLPDAASLETVLAGLDPASAAAELLPALAAAFPGFDFSLARIDDDYWRDTWSVIWSDGTRRGCFFLMTHGHWVDSDVGLAPRVRQPDPDARVLLRWADRACGF